MTQLQYEKVKSIKGIRGGCQLANGYTVNRGQDGSAIIRGKIMVSSLEQIMAQLPKDSAFVRDYSNINAFLTSDSLEQMKKQWLEEYGPDAYIKKVCDEWEGIVSQVPREELWLMFNILRCEDVDSFAAALDVLL